MLAQGGPTNSCQREILQLIYQFVGQFAQNVNKTYISYFVCLFNLGDPMFADACRGPPVFSSCANSLEINPLHFFLYPDVICDQFDPPIL